MAPDKPPLNSKYKKCTRPYCWECRSRVPSAPVRISEVCSLENARVPVSNIPPRAEEIVSIGKSQVSTVQQTESAVDSLAKLSIIGVNQQRYPPPLEPNWKVRVCAQKQKEEKEGEENLMEKFKNINLNESPTE